MAFDTYEYSDEAGQPVELFLFMNGSTPYAYSSADEPTDYNGHTYVATDYLECEDVEDLAEGSGRNSTKIKTHRLLPVAQLFQTTPPPNPVWLTIYRYHRGDSEIKRFWGGKVRAVKFDGEEAEIEIESDSAALERAGIWKTYQDICNHIVYSAECGLSDGANSHLITVSLIDGNNIEAQSNGIGALGNGYCTAGQVRRLSNNDRRAVTAHVGNVLTLLQPFEGLQVGEQLYVFAGCDGTKATCSSGKFKDGGGNPVNNLDNHGGFDIPVKNPVQVGLS